MPALSSRRGGAAARILFGLGLGFASVAVLAPACKPKASSTQCDQLVERYAELVVTERIPDASAQVIHDEQQREKGEARGDDAFKNCSSEVSKTEFDCAMRAPTADSLEKCLE